MVARRTPANVTLRWLLVVNKAATSGPEIEPLLRQENRDFGKLVGFKKSGVFLTYLIQG